MDGCGQFHCVGVECDGGVGIISKPETVRGEQNFIILEHHDAAVAAHDTHGRSLGQIGESDFGNGPLCLWRHPLKDEFVIPEEQAMFLVAFLVKIDVCLDLFALQMKPEEVAHPWNCGGLGTLGIRRIRGRTESDRCGDLWQQDRKQNRGTTEEGQDRQNVILECLHVASGTILIRVLTIHPFTCGASRRG